MTYLLTSSKYDSIQTTASSILSTYYGNPTQSSQITQGTSVKALDWSNLYSDLNKCLIHQAGHSIPWPSITTGSVINSTFINSLTNLAQSIYVNSNVIDNTQITTKVSSSTRTSTWGSDIALKVEYNWQTSQDVAHFFQSGGYISPSLSISQNNLSNQLNVYWGELITNTYSDYNFQNYELNLSGYGTPPAHYVNTNNNIGNITVSYTFTSPTTLVASIVFHPEGDYLAINVLPQAAFTLHQSTGAVLAPAVSVQLIETLDVGGASLYPSLYFYPVSQTTINKLSTGTVNILVTNSGTGVCSVSSLSFSPDSSSSFTDSSLTISTASIAVGTTATITLKIDTSNSSEGTFYNNSVTIVSNNVNGNATVTFPVLVINSIFSIKVVPGSVNSVLTSATTIVQNYAFSSVGTGDISSITGYLDNTSNFYLNLSQPVALPTVGIAPWWPPIIGIVGFEEPRHDVSPDFWLLDPIEQIIDDIISITSGTISTSTIPFTTVTNTFPGVIATTFVPPIPPISYVNTASAAPPPTLISGTYTNTMHLTFNPVDSRQSPVSLSVPLSYTLDIQNNHIGHWVSAFDYTNNVAGFSYDIIEGQKYLTIGFGMAGDGGPELFQTGTVYVSYKTLGIGADVKPQEGIALYPSTSPSYCSFLQTYGAWITPNGGNGYETNLSVTYDVYVPFSGSYNFEFAADASGDLLVNGNKIAVSAGPTSSVVVSANLNLGKNTIEIQTQAYANSTNSSLYSGSGALSNNDVNYVGPIYEKVNARPLKTSGTVTTGLASFGVKITDVSGTIWWSTLNPQRPLDRPAYHYWGEVYRIPITGEAKIYQSGDYPIKLTDFAGGTTYGSYCGTGTNAGSAFTVVDDGNGNLGITFNPWPALASTGFPTVDITLSLFEYLPYYYINIIPRLLNLEAPFNNAQYTHYFNGIGNDGHILKSTVAFPNPTVVNGVLAISGAGGTKHLSFLQTAIKDLVQIGTLAVEGAAIVVGLSTVLGAIGVEALGLGSIIGGIAGAAAGAAEGVGAIGTVVAVVLSFCGF